jgi:hypothetical protein
VVHQRRGKREETKRIEEENEEWRRRNNVLIFTQWIDDVFRCVDERNIKQVFVPNLFQVFSSFKKKVE